MNMRRGDQIAGGRDLATLASDFGSPLPPAVEPAPMRSDPNLFDELIGVRGRRRRGQGWAPAPAPLSVWRMTSEQLGGVWPLISANGLPATGAAMGIDVLAGTAFYVDLIGWTLAALLGVTNPNMMIFGAPGRGKSATIKTLLLRLLEFGYRGLILGDVKDEYEVLCRALGVEPHAIGHGLPARINALDFGPLGNDWTGLSREEAQQRATLVFSRWLTLIRALVGAHKVTFDPSAETVIEHVIRTLTGYAAGATQLAEITLPQVWAALDDPSEELVRDCRFASRQDFLDHTRLLRDALRTMVKGRLAGLFDQKTTIDVDWSAPIQSLSLSRLAPLGDEAVGVALTCLNSWGRAMTQVAAPGDLRIIVRDEAWKQMRLGLDAVLSLDADLRLSRNDGAIQVVAAHKPSDMLTVGDAGSQAVAVARDMLHLCGTKVLMGQDEEIGTDLSALLGLGPMAEHIVTDWANAGRGRALWVVGKRQFKVQGVLAPIEQRLTFTNDAISAEPAA